MTKIRKIYANEDMRTEARIIGKQGENGATAVYFPLISGMSQSLSILRNGDTTPYPKTVSVKGDYFVWTLDTVDTYVPGAIYAEAIYTNSSGNVQKSVTYIYAIAKSLGDPSATAPEPYEDWYSKLVAIGSDVADSATIASNAATTSTNAAATATEKADEATEKSEEIKTLVYEAVMEKSEATDNTKIAYTVDTTEYEIAEKADVDKLQECVDNISAKLEYPTLDEAKTYLEVS